MSAVAAFPVIVIGAGPVGLAAAAQFRSRDIDVVVLESGPFVGAAVAEWGHVRLFSSWAELMDPVAVEMLGAAGWVRPPSGEYPTGAEWVSNYLRPLGDLLGGAVRCGAKVTAVTRHDRDRLVSSGRDEAAFTVHVHTADGAVRMSARAVVDASGTWSGPNPLGGDGVAAIGERQWSERISYRLPDLHHAAAQARYAGKHVVVAGTGASAKGALIALTSLARSHRSTRVSWLIRRPEVAAAFAGGGQDELPERGALGRMAQAAVESGPVTTFRGFRTVQVLERDGTLELEASDGQVVREVDEVIVLTGFRPDLQMLSEIRLDLDPVMQAPRELAPLIDPNEHSCGTVYPHGARELSQPEVGFYLVGMKSYGRATSFLALTGYEQVRSVAAAIAGDHEAAARVELVLPDTGVCGGAGVFDELPVEVGGCCG